MTMKPSSITHSSRPDASANGNLSRTEFKDALRRSNPGGSPQLAPSASQQPQGANDQWTHSHPQGGLAQINLGDKYTIYLNANQAAWTLFTNKTGAATEVWGEPHVEATSALNFDKVPQEFSFKNNLTFKLADGTKITVETVPFGGPKGQTLTSKLIITNGNNAMVVKGLAMDKDGAHNLNIEQSNNGKAIDAQTKDGDMTLEEVGPGWFTPQCDPYNPNQPAQLSEPFQDTVDFAESLAEGPPQFRPKGTCFAQQARSYTKAPQPSPPGRSPGGAHFDPSNGPGTD